MSKGPIHRTRLRAAVAYPSVTVALVAVVALALTSFGPSQVIALAATTDPVVAAPAMPTPTVDPTASATPTVDPTATTVPSTVSPTPDLAVSPGAAFSSHHVVAHIDGPALPAIYLAIDDPASGASQFQTFRLRFRFNNAGTDMIATPQLEFSAAGANSFVAVPETPELGQAFHMAAEWVPSGSGTAQGPLGEDIAVAHFLLGAEGGTPETGHHSMGANPDQPITLPQGSYTEEEFTVSISVDAKYLAGYDFRITNAGVALTTDLASISLGAQPEPGGLLSPGQRQGVTVVDPSTTSTAAAAYPLLTVADTTSAAVMPGVSSPSATLYPLAAGAISTAAEGSITVKISEAGVKGSHSTMADQCGVCHRGHTARGPNLLAESSQSTLCFACHGGQAANANVQAEYADPLPANKPDTREYFSHDAATATTSPKHTRSSQLDEFAGLSNRHSECADCHNSHRAGTTDSTQTATGWDASPEGPLAGVSGASVVNGAADTTPAPAAYTFLDGVDKPITSEYQLCFKCHSSFTTLLPNISGKPSTDALDKAAELNPANASFHPIEAAGKNGTDAMKLSLAGTSPNKLWNFNIGSTIRCLNCHASSTTPDTGPADAAGAGGSLPAHTSGNRGILLRGYLDRQLKPAVDTASVKAAYSAGDFALCYVCHGEAPFVDSSSNATNFNLHAKHVTSLGVGKGGTDIDTAGDGQGNAICAECHFRIHSATNKVGSQEIPGSRLLNFAPNVEPFVPSGAISGTISWTPGATGGGSCTLTCHGQPHDAYPYK